MNIILITPPGPSTRTGNAVAALRWARILRHLRHRVTVAADYADQVADAMVAIHAWRSADAIRRFKAQYPARPLILQLSGTLCQSVFVRRANCKDVLRHMKHPHRLRAPKLFSDKGSDRK